MKIEGNQIVAQIEEHFFEGTEKLLELWFASSYRDDNADLRLIERLDWERILKNVNCEIISQKSNSSITAYVLSESSLFIAKNRFILKTCGKTTLLAAVGPVLELVREKCGFDIIIDCFYSHKNFMRPELQPETHRSFDDEVSTLDTIFDGGAAYALGKINQDCWYLFTIDNIGVCHPDQTLEIIMTKIDPNVMAMFTQDYGLTAAELTDKSGISGLIPGAMIDDFLFSPCGYSMNGILPNGGYFTIHITPEPDFSYVSFETNVPVDSYHDLVSQILEIFRPGKFQMTLFANELSSASELCLRSGEITHYKGYRKTDHQLCQLKNYNLIYTLYSSVVNGRPPAQ